MRFIALLRGVNVGGKNRVPMKELQDCFEEIGFTNVKTYINSGNVLFDSDTVTDESALQEVCQREIESRFGFPIALSVIKSETLADSMKQAPEWWDIGKEEKHNALFVIYPATAEEVLAEMGELNPEYEKAAYSNNIIFLTSSIKYYSRTKFSKIVGTEAYQKVTIRNANTTKKLLMLSEYK